MKAEVKTTQFELDANTQNKDFLISDRKWVLSFIEKKFLKMGVEPKWAVRFSKSVARALDSSTLSNEKKKWALRRGFLPNSIQLYNLNEENYKSYLPDIDYMCLHPLNNHFAFWINDKITLKYLFSKPLCINKETGEYINIMPDYYLYIENDGHYSYLMDSPSDIEKNEDYLLNLLKRVGELALKPSNGGGGYGFVRLVMSEGKIIWNDDEIEEQEFKNRIGNLKGYIITEFVRQHKDFDSVWNKSACTLRINVIKNVANNYSGGEYSVIGSYARFGTIMSDGACNMHAGGVAVAFDINTGNYGDVFFRYTGFEGNKNLYDSHPDTKAVLKGKKLPYLEQVRDSVFAICNYLSSLDYMGIDLVITDNGVKMLEINSLPAASTPQVLCGPYMDNPHAKAFFMKKRETKKNNMCI